ncbi:MAG: transcription-repair coupling factor [Spirochaetales bacterium]
MITLLVNAITKALKKDLVFQALLDDFQKNRLPLRIEGSQGFFQALTVQALVQASAGPVFVVAPSDNEANALIADLDSLGVDAELFPWWGTLLYQGISAQASIFGHRSRVLSRLVQGKAQVVVLSLRSLLFPVPPSAVFAKNLTTWQVGNTINVAKTAELLVKLGYSRVPRVSVPGEFALRGEVLDLYLQGDDDAVRVVFDFDKIEDIKRFNPLTQSSTSVLKELTVYPAREMVWTDDLRATLEANVLARDLGDGALNHLDELATTGDFRGVELFYPLAFDQLTGLWDYAGLGGKAPGLFLFLDWDHQEQLDSAIRKERKQLFEESRKLELALPPPEAVFFQLPALKVLEKRSVQFQTLKHDTDTPVTLHKLECDPGRSFFGNVPFFKEEVETLLANQYQVFVFAESQSQAQRISFLLGDLAVTVVPHSISAGFALPRHKLIVIGENEIFGRRKRAPASLKKTNSQAIDSFVDLSPNDFVVHLNYGIGQFQGIERIRAGGNERDYIKIAYGGEETIFLPIEQVNLIQRYIGSEGREPRLDILGGKTWEKKKANAKKSVEELADRLILLYAKRQNAQGYQFPKDNDWQMSFEAAFPYQDTVDQAQASVEIKADMESPRPMDRLLCGDVGYGKTEVSMRAAFKAVIGGKQVAFLAPTTILAEQHFENFTERFKRFPVRIGMMSRFVPKAEQKKNLEKLAKGELDILIGTHRLLQKDVLYKNLGLLVVDEEQRFGVKDKERLKELKASIDCLAMSATPIPRTLHMSLLKIRDMSVLRTAPVNRQPIETFIQELKDETVVRAIRRETQRGGQVFFLHNRVETLEMTQTYLQGLLPELMIRTAHGQMHPLDLEEVMHDFVHGNFQVLVSTTIIENGIDIPNVNTIIIDQADMYGISQLYQLRGRVGRSGKEAYAYLLYPEGRALTELAMKRLQVISDFTELGAGFKIAMKDLEVRGAGNLLGAEQSGDILSVGFEMYLKLLDEAVAEKMGETRDQPEEIFLELDYSGFIPDTYIQDATDKMDVYKKIASVVGEDDLERVFTEIHDRFGPLPDEVQSLLSIAEVQIICRKLRIISLRERGGICTVEFGKMMDFPFEKAMRLLKESGGKVRSNPAKPNQLVLETSKVGLAEKSAFLRERLSRLL